MKMYLRTKCGDQYHILENGDIVRLDQKDFQPSGQWKMLGIHHVKRNEFIPLNFIEPDANFPWTYKNGNPQWTVVDVDRGTRRIWGNTKYDGIETLRIA